MVKYRHTKDNSTKGKTMSYEFSNTVGGKLLAELRDAVMECIEVPNHLLPEEYRNNRDGVRTLAELEAMHSEATQPSQHQLDKAAKAERCEKYRKQWEANESIEYDVDEDRLYKNELTFCKLADEAGWIELDDE